MDYEKKYNEALEVAKKNLEAIDTQAEGCTFSGVGFKNTLIHCFPELAESEDEKIRKDIIEYFKDKRVDDGIQPMLESWIAWLEKQSPSAYELGHAEGMRVKNKEGLEKQGEQKDFGMKSAEESLGVSSETYNKIVDECIYGEHKHVEWSEEDENKMNNLIQHLRVAYSQCDWLDETINWIKFLSPQKKQEWSEEDEEMLKSILATCKMYAELVPSSPGKHLLEMQENWLKSHYSQKQWKPSEQEKAALRTAIHIMTKERYFPKLGAHLQNILDVFEGQTRVEWKPSEEQLEALNTVNVAGGLRYVGQEGALISLYKDLKALQL